MEGVAGHVPISPALERSPERAGIGGSIPSLATTPAHTKRNTCTYRRAGTPLPQLHRRSTDSDTCPYFPNGIVCSVRSRG